MQHQTRTEKRVKMAKEVTYMANEIAEILSIGRQTAGLTGKAASVLRSQNGAIVNKHLARLGLIVKAKRGDGGWRLTPKGANYGIPGVLSKGKVDENGEEELNPTLRWAEKTIEFLRPHVQSMTEASLQEQIDELKADNQSLFAQLERIERLLCNIVEVTPGVKDFDPPYERVTFRKENGETYDREVLIEDGEVVDSRPCSQNESEAFAAE